MRSFLIELARLAGRIALEHYRTTGVKDVTVKGRGDYVTHVDRRIEEALAHRIRTNYPDHRVLGEETHAEWPAEVAGPCWIIDPIDGTTNYLRGIPQWAVSICYCDDHAVPRHAAVYDPVKKELFLAERDAGSWLNEDRIYVSDCTAPAQALTVSALPFRRQDALADVAQVMVALQAKCDDFRRGGSAALDLAYVAAGRIDAYWELGIQPWDVAGGELLVREAGGVATDFRGRREGLLGRRSILAAATAPLHAALAAEVAPLHRWLDHEPYVKVG